MTCISDIKIGKKEMDSKYLVLAWKHRIWAVVPALAVIAIIAVRPMYWLGSIGFIWVMFWLVVAVGILVTIERFYKTESLTKAFLASSLLFLLVAGIVVAGVMLYQSKPDLTASEVKTIVNKAFGSNYQAMSVEYRGEGIWRVRLIGVIRSSSGSSGGLWYLDYSESTGELSVKH